MECVLSSFRKRRLRVALPAPDSWMLESTGQAVAAKSSPSMAALLCHAGMSAEDYNLTRLLDFFGIAWRAIGDGPWTECKSQTGYAVISSVKSLAAALRVDGNQRKDMPSWFRQAHSVYIYDVGGDDASHQLLRYLTRAAEIRVATVEASEMTVEITGDAPDEFGPMSSLKIRLALREPIRVCSLRSPAAGWQSLVGTSAGDLFFKFTCGGIPCYVNTGSRTIDLRASCTAPFDVKKSFCEAVPLTLYLKSTFQDHFPLTHETSACLIVDDPPLKRRYGFLDYREALSLMDVHNFTMTIAFIPWNWRRYDSSTLRLFQSRPERMGIAIHGCDHSTAEFAERSPALLNRLISTSIHRMDLFRKLTSIDADRIMVFPQGEFSPETGRILKLNGFDAVVNTEVAPSKGAPNQTTIADLWSVANIKYGTFPFFSRRYVVQGIENFAFDGLLGKPCLIAAHHDVFRDHGRGLVDFVGRLNSLKWNLVWRPLAEAVHRSLAHVRQADGTIVTRMFGSTLMLANPFSEARAVAVIKQESDAQCVLDVSVNRTAVDYHVGTGLLSFGFTMGPESTATIRIRYRNDQEARLERRRLKHGLEIAVKRHLSEFRDNYVSKNDFLSRSATRIKRLLK